MKAEIISESGQRDEKGRFVPGSKVAGRPKGSLQASSKEVRQVMTDMLAGNLVKAQQKMDLLSPKDFIAATIAMANIVLPKLSAVAIGGEGADEIKKGIYLIGDTQIEF